MLGLGFVGQRKLSYGQGFEKRSATKEYINPIIQK